MKRYVTLSYVLEGVTVPRQLPSLEELIYQGVQHVAGMEARASDATLSYETETAHESFTHHQDRFTDSIGHAGIILSIDKLEALKQTLKEADEVLALCSTHNVAHIREQIARVLKWD